MQLLCISKANRSTPRLELKSKSHINTAPRTTLLCDAGIKAVRDQSDRQCVLLPSRTTTRKRIITNANFYQSSSLKQRYFISFRVCECLGVCVCKWVLVCVQTASIGNLNN